MKRLFIIRHAKSSWENTNLDDFDRPLNKRGQNDAPFMAKLLKDKAIMPDIILSSSALRAKLTSAIIAKELNIEDKIEFISNIYEASLSKLEDIIKKIENRHNCAFVVGHNPGLNALAYELVDFDENIPTTGIIQIEFNIDNWKDISKKNAKLISFDYPKKYKKKG